MQPLLLAFAIVETVEGACRARKPLDLETAANAIVARFPETGVTRGEVVEVLREEATAAGLIFPDQLRG